MLRVLMGIAIIAAIVLVMASASMNYLFASSMGRTALEGAILGAVAVGVDMLKAVLAVFLGYAARQKRWLFVAIGSLAFVLFSALSLAAAFGFTATNRQEAIGERERGNHRLSTLERQASELQTRLRGLPAHRILALVDAELETKRMDARWSASRECTAIVTARVREFCEEIGRLRAERIASQEAARLERLIAALEIEMALLRKAGSDIAADPQARSMAQALGLSEAEVRRGLSALLALVVEVGSALGVYIALGHGIEFKRSETSTKIEAARETPQEDATARDTLLKEAPASREVATSEDPQQPTPEPEVTASPASPAAARPSVAVSVKPRRNVREHYSRKPNGSG